MFKLQATSESISPSDVCGSVVCAEVEALDTLYRLKALAREGA